MQAKSGRSWLLVGAITLLTAACASTGPGDHPGGRPVALTSVEPDTLQPLLQWTSFRPPQTPAATTSARAVATSPVTYDLRIWRAESGYPAAPVYDREGLPETAHRLERTLEPATDYLWSVRARFDVGGHVRVSDWAVTQAPRLPLLPHPFLARFRTPPR